MRFERGFQMSWFPPRVLEGLGVCPGAAVLVRGEQGHSWLCRAYPEADSNTALDCTVLVPPEGMGLGQALLRDWPHQAGQDITPVGLTGTAKEVEVVVVCSTVQGMARNLRNTAMPHVVRDILSQMVVANNAVVFTEHDPLAQMYGICALCVVKGKVKQAAFKVGQGTAIKVRWVEHKERYMKGQAQLGGMEEMRKRLEKAVHGRKKVLVHGMSGCGKSSMVRAVVGESTHLVELDGTVMEGSEPGEAEAALREVFQQAKDIAEVSSCVLLLEGVDLICPEHKQSMAQARVATQLLLLLESVSHAVISTTSRVSDLDPAFRRPGRTDEEMYVPVPDRAERAAILNHLLAGFETDLAPRVADVTPGYIGADLVQVARAIAHVSQSKPVGEDDVHRVVSEIQPSPLRGALGTVEFAPVSYDDIGGAESVKETLKSLIEWPLRHPDAFVRLQIPTPKGVLMYGPPGCAKTTLARAVATSANVNFLAVSPAELYSPYVGDTEKAIAELFHRARMGAPTLLFLDEIDSLVGNRQGDRHGIQQKLLLALLQEMDGIGVRGLGKGSSSSSQVIVVAATNRPDMLDPALTRPGRLDRHVYVPPPDRGGRIATLKVVSKSMPLDTVDLETVAGRTERFSGADLMSLCREAALTAMQTRGMDVDSVTMADFEVALDHVKPSLTLQQINWYESYASGHARLV